MEEDGSLWRYCPGSHKHQINKQEIVKGAEITPELLPPVTKSKKISKKAKKAAHEEDLAKKKSQQRRSTSDLIGRHQEDGGGTMVGREMRAQALAKQSATLRTIKEKERERDTPEPPKPRRKSIEYNGRPSVMLGAEVTRAMKWADGNYDAPSQQDRGRGVGRSGDRPAQEKLKVVAQVMEKPKALPEKPQPQPRLEKPQPPQPRPETVYQTADLIAPPPPSVPLPKKEPVQEIPREPKPKELPKVQPPRSLTPEPTTSLPNQQLKAPSSGPVLLSPDSASFKSADRTRSPPSKFKKFFGGGKSKEEKAAKRVSRVSSPIPPSPTPPVVQPTVISPPTPEPRAPSPIPETAKHWEEDFDGTHREEDLSTPIKPEDYARIASQPEEYRPATPPPVPTFRAETPTRNSEDSDRERWAQIRKLAGQRVLNRTVAPVARSDDDDEVMDVNIPRVRQPAVTGSPKRAHITPKADDEAEESVDARVARIRKRVQELTAGMGDD